MKKTYSVWASRCQQIGHTLVGGEEPLRFANGRFDGDCEIRLYTFEANTHEEAMAIYYLRQGWAPYKPEGNAEPCPECGAMYYPQGSGECWRCPRS
ncbi:MAG: hypothetical protein HYV16_10595 [Gammaproteobacteria bacterium]|nr:hypothetical protein [Gammaproteobacteria bacterium]